MSAVTPTPLAPRDEADALRLMGNGFNLPEVKALYDGLLANQPKDGVRASLDQAYGPHSRHRLDIYLPDASQTVPPGGWPVLVAVHGGGFIRGDKAMRANVGWYFARQGVAVVVPNYRLAPDAHWPSGPEDIVSVCQWVRAQADTLGLDADSVILQGESAGAAHVAAASLIRRFQPEGWRIAGAICLSGPYAPCMERLARPVLGIDTPDPRNDAYFGTDDVAALQGMSIIDQVDAAPFPLMIGVAERDLGQMQIQAGALFHELVRRHGYLPQWLMVRDHNHFSQTYSVGTGDTALAQPMSDFMQRCWADRA
jgi:acetyl esterase